jgi:LysR family glycine cleavage system transcriptional activator
MKKKTQKEKPSARSARLPLNAVRVFEAVAAQRSFSAASDALHVTTAAVSMQIKSLEQYLQVRLFRRNRRDVQLTAEGESLLPFVRRGLDELELGFRAVKSARGSALVISVLGSFLQRWLLRRLPDFRTAHPKIDLQIRASTAVADFARDDVHIAIRFGRGGWPRLHAERLMDDWLVAVCTPELLKRYGRLRGPGHTGDYPLLHSSSEPWDVWLTGNDEDKELWPMTGTAFDDSVAVAHAAEQGQGLALVRWSLAADQIAEGRVVLAHPQALRFARSYYFVCPEPYLTLPKVAAFRDWMRSVAESSPKPLSSEPRP